MKKSLSLLAILGLLLLVSNVFAVAPVFNDIPDLKIYKVTQGLTPAFDLAQFNSGDVATAYSITANGLGLTSLTGSSVNQGGYANVTVANNTYRADNAGGFGSQSNKAKYATYKIYKLPKVGLNVGKSYTINMANYAYNSTGLSIPPSFGNNQAISVSDVSKVTAYWSGNNIVINSIAAATGPVYVDVIAAPNASAPYGTDQDKEQIEVNSNLLSNSTFSTAADTTSYGAETIAGKPTEPASGWLASANDGAGVASDGGVWTLTAADNTQAVKVSAFASIYVSESSTKWYTARMKIAAGGANTDTFILFNYTGLPTPATHTDVAAHVIYGIPTTWTWIEAPVQNFANTANGYPQFQYRPIAAGSVMIDEIQIVQAAPTLVDASRGNTRAFYSYGDFDAGADSTGWGREVYGGAAGEASYTVANGLLTVNFSGSQVQGIKWTANNGGSPGTVYTPQVTAGREVGTRVKFAIASGSFNSLGIVLAAAYGVQSNGNVNIGVAPADLEAAAQIGTLIGGEFRTVGLATNSYYQFQFGFRSDIAGSLNVDYVDFDNDSDDPNFGNGSLFP